MTRCLWQLSLLGLAFAGPAIAISRDSSPAEAQPVVLAARQLDDGKVLFEKRQRQTVFITSGTSTAFASAASGGSSSTVMSVTSTATSAITASIPATTAVASSAPPSSAAQTGSTATGSATNAANAAGNSATASPTPSPAASGSGGLSGGAIAGIVVGVVAALAIAAGLGYFLARRRKSRHSDNANMPAFGQGQSQQPPPAMKETSAPYAGPSTGNGVYTSVTAGYQPAQQQVSHPTFSELPADSRPLQPPQPPHVQQSVPESPHGRSELETRE